MLFNSLPFILLFLPITAVVFNLINRANVTAGKLFMIAASAYFYVYVTYSGAPLLIASCIISYMSYKAIMQSTMRKASLFVGVLANALMLCALKYNHFIPPGANQVTDWIQGYGMPLAVSFFTFQQISLLVDAYKGNIKQASVIDYLYYVLFFPKMIAGPITRWQTLMPQTNTRGLVKSTMVLMGLTVISIGLFKKVVLSGLFSRYADIGYSHTETISFIEAWITTLSYTAQIYFDFSGYSDIAIGAALLFGIRLPDNFNSPYKAVNIRDFWSRWHISLSTWLRDYIYIPLGGSRKGLPRTITNLLVTFLISGSWHGSDVNFILWGLMHGVATSINVIWERSGLHMPIFAGWLITFLFINISWIPFRADSLQSALSMISAMVRPNIASMMEWLHSSSRDRFSFLHSIFTPDNINTYSAIYIAIAMTFILKANNTGYIIRNGNGSATRTILSGIALSLSIILMFGGATASQFIYSAF